MHDEPRDDTSAEPSTSRPIRARHRLRRDPRGDCRRAARIGGRRAISRFAGDSRVRGPARTGHDPDMGGESMLERARHGHRPARFHLPQTDRPGRQRSGFSRAARDATTALSRAGSGVSTRHEPGRLAGLPGGGVSWRPRRFDLVCGPFAVHRAARRVERTDARVHRRVSARVPAFGRTERHGRRHPL